MVMVLQPCLGLLISDNDFSCAFVHIYLACFYCFRLESSFDPQASFDGTLLQETFLLAIPPQPSLPTSLKIDTSKADISASSSFHVSRSDNGLPGGLKFVDLMESGFLPAVLVQGSLMDLFRVLYQLYRMAVTSLISCHAKLPQYP